MLSVRLEIPVPDIVSLLYRLNNEATGLVNHNDMVNSNKIANHNDMVNSKESAVIQEVFDSLARMGWASFVKNRLPLLKLPQEILEALQTGKIAYTKALAIARVKDEQLRRTLLEEAISSNLSLSQIKERIQSLQQKSESNSDALPQRLKITYQQINKSKIWEDPKKRKQLEKILNQLETLIQPDQSSSPKSNS
ncbi:MAG: hypothetical protein HC820_09985 [Hydrococcus sp. RM1_1_31]|nr:hypothetical protein [Hydrococcus sp. RM1_1_31]